MFALQPRLEHPRGRRALRVLEHPRFRAAYDCCSCARSRLAPQERADWWKRLQEVSPAEREQMLSALEVRRHRVRRRASRRAQSAPPRSARRHEGAVSVLAAVYIGVGSNVDDPAARVRLAVSKLGAIAAFRVV